MVELVLVVFLICMATLATMAIRVGLKMIDFMQFITVSIKKIEARQDEIVRLLQRNQGRERENDNP